VPPVADHVLGPLQGVGFDDPVGGVAPAVVDALGLAVGGGYYTAALLATGLVFVTLGALSRIDEWVLHDNHILLTVFTRDLPGQIVHVNECLEDMNLTVHTVKTTRSQDGDRAPPREFELFNHAKVTGGTPAEAIGRIEGVTGVSIA